MNKVEMSLEQVFELIKVSLERGLYDNARNILEDLIKEYERRARAKA